MSKYDLAAGQLLRRFRKQRGFTLHHAARLLNTSSPVLSRKERGADPIERSDIEFAVQAYDLSAWEAYELWTAAGLIPEPTLSSQHVCSLQEFADTLLPELPFPAFILDILGYVAAWNEDIEAIWHPSRAGSARIHIIEDLFSQRLRQQLGDRWKPYVQQAIRVFYHKTLRVANDPAFNDVLQMLIVAHGREFIDLWNQAQGAGEGRTVMPPATLGATIVHHPSPHGMIDYLVMQSTFQVPQEYELIMYVPLGRDNQERYRQIKLLMGPGRVYFRH